ETSQTILSTTYNNIISMNLSYIEIPLLAKLSIQTGSAFVPIIYAGPCVSILTNGIRISETTVNDKTTKIIKNLNNDLNIFDVGIVAGAGFEIKAGPGSIILEGRYSMGFNSIYNIPEFTEQPDIKTSAITIIAGYSF
ncbi:MAG: PorT family protein, partial [Candidatus Goldbacteria bacterium]|nr:PorT family protein [Candidatus Goldiibacteriota bacterium]